MQMTSSFHDAESQFSSDQMTFYSKKYNLFDSIRRFCVSLCQVTYIAAKQDHTNSFLTLQYESLMESYYVNT